jgi:hypothetical protein
MHALYFPIVCECMCAASRRFVVRSGLQYGADWVLYRGAPGSVHSEMCLRVVPPQDALPAMDMPWNTLGNLTRIAPDVMKLMVLCLLTPRGSGGGGGGDEGARPSSSSVSSALSLDIDGLDLRPVVCSTRRHVVQSRSDYGTPRRSQAAFQRAARRNKAGRGSAGASARSVIAAPSTTICNAGPCSSQDSGFDGDALDGSASDGGGCYANEGDTDSFTCVPDDKRAKYCES